MTFVQSPETTSRRFLVMIDGLSYVSFNFPSVTSNY